jgi:hypothetical protein
VTQIQQKMLWVGQTVPFKNDRFQNGAEARVRQVGVGKLSDPGPARTGYFVSLSRTVELC